MTTPATTQDETLVDTVDLVSRLNQAAGFLAEMRDEAVGPERTRLSSKIEGVQACTRSIEKTGAQERFLGTDEILGLVQNMDPGTRPVTEHLTEIELGISKGCRLVVAYTLNMAAASPLPRV